MKIRTGMLATAIVAALSPLLASCAPAVTSAPRTELRVAAASSLRIPLEAMAPAFEAATGATLVFDFAASGVLQKQIEAGAPVDVFASASPRQIDALAARGLVSVEGTVTIAGNDLVVFVPRGNPKAITGPASLSRAERIATGNPDTAPHGTKAREWLTSLGVWDALAPKLVFAENAAQTLDYVERGEVDAGIGFGSDAARDDRVTVVYTVPRGAIPPIRYVAAPVRSAADPGLAKRFVAYLTSDAGQSALKAAGFLAAEWK